MGYSAATSTLTASPLAAHESRSAVIMRGQQAPAAVGGRHGDVGERGRVDVDPAGYGEGRGEAAQRADDAVAVEGGPGVVEVDHVARHSASVGFGRRRRLRKPVRMASTQRASSDAVMVRTSTAMAAG